MGGARRPSPSMWEMVGTIPPRSSLVSAAWRQGLIVKRGVLGKEEELTSGGRR